MANIKTWGTKIPRSGAGLRDMLFEQLERLRDGQVEAPEAAAAAHLASAIIKSAQVEINYHRAKKAGDIPADMEIELVDTPKLAAPTPAKSDVKQG